MAKIANLFAKIYLSNRRLSKTTKTVNDNYLYCPRAVYTCISDDVQHVVLQD